LYIALLSHKDRSAVSDKLSLVELRGKTVRVVGLKQRVS
jgi:hypothetical protein